MSVYNTEKFLKESITSILSQTLTDFEFIIVDDASTDKSIEIVKSFNDQRILLIEKSNNEGLPTCLNIGLEAAKGKYIARMDADDIALPERLQVQFDFLEKNPDVGLCGSWFTRFGECKTQLVKPPLCHAEIKVALLFDTPLAHPTIMFRRELFQEKKLYYDPLHIRSEDWGLWRKCAVHMKIRNIPTNLLKYRVVNSSLSNTKNQEREAVLKKIDLENLKALNIAPTEVELAIHRCLCWGHIQSHPYLNLNHILSWVEKIITSNKVTSLYNQKYLIQSLSCRWFTICKSTELGFLQKLTTYFKGINRSSLKMVNPVFLLKSLY